MSDQGRLLFHERYLRDTIENRRRKMLEEIDLLEANSILNVSMDDLCDYFEANYKLDLLQLKEESISMDQIETQVDISQNQLFNIWDRTKLYFIKGVCITFYIPFEGEQELFHNQASTYTSSPPFGEVGIAELVLAYTRTDHKAEAVKAEFKHDLFEIQRHIKWANQDAAQYNSTLRECAKQNIEIRREKLLKDQNMVASLGYPIRQRNNISLTYSVPAIRKKLPTPKLPASTAPFTPEPVLDMKDYECILSVISSMVRVMEQSPKAFKNMGEEDLRQHFLVQLNGLYEGQATGETFNFNGKTDIIIKVNGKNIFIAECKLWKGPESLRKAIDQVISYATWRDTKLALIIFNRNKHLSAVLDNIPEIVKGHSNFKRILPYSSETGFRFALHHKDDINREMILTILIFEVPK